MSYLNLIVKGNKFKAAKAASARGVAFAFHHETKYGETVGRAPDTQLEAVRAWFHESNKRPFPAGTLLSWGEIDRV